MGRDNDDKILYTHITIFKNYDPFVVEGKAMVKAMVAEQKSYDKAILERDSWNVVLAPESNGEVVHWRAGEYH